MQALYLRLTERLLPGLHGDRASLPFSKELLKRDRKLLQLAHDNERRRGIAGHWTFDPNRLIALRQAVALASTLARKLEKTI
ncbi:hypothetical protein HPQ64_17140 [Rhizobiales bacterium]|uniref:hypothetical protein n=1 Tax=Hongsoonwoonella zoysiae TaxID=2821844 RepID=UPI00156174C7|nr:hypothetical protein [Hongsoonwoonella zoysiae]NRG19420.1 hypothetical protein [Hongsoonwoonella zoysiae]